MSERVKILLLTNSEFGQANVNLAVYYELLLREDVDVHIASFGDLEGRVRDTAERAKRASPAQASPGSWHLVVGRKMYPHEFTKRLMSAISHRPGFFGCFKAYPSVPELVCPWEVDEYMVICNSIMKMIESLNPDLIVLETLFSPAMDACNKLKRDWVQITPSALLDNARPFQPWLGSFWRYPALGSGFSFPLSALRSLANVVLFVRLISILIFSPRLKSVNVARHAAGFPGLHPTMSPNLSVPYILPSLLDCEYPMVVPSHFHCCGPMLVPAPPLSTTDPSLLSWLSRGPTVLIVLGSHYFMDTPRATHFAEALCLLRSTRPDVQVLWKLIPSPVAALSREIALSSIQADIDADKIRTVEWLEPDPLALLQTGHVVCWVNHAGANSWFEGIATGVPQINTPAWFDCYEYASRTEWLGVGVWGNKKAAPELESRELGSALLLVVGPKQGVESEATINARTLGRKVGTDGRVKAARKIVEIAQEWKAKQKVKQESTLKENS